MRTPEPEDSAAGTMPAIDLAFDAIGVPWRVEAHGRIPAQAESEIERRIAAFDAAWSRFRPDSLVTEASNSATCTLFPPEGAPLFSLYRELYDATRGSVTPFVGDTLAALGYGPTTEHTGSGLPAWEEIARVAGSLVQTLRPVTIDVGAAGKGLLVDIVSDTLAELGATSSIVDASGDLRVRATGEPVRIALEHPNDPRSAIGVVELTEGALCASASNRRAWGPGLHHVLDGRTGWPVRSIADTWAVAEEAMIADGVATALFFLSPAEVLERFGVHGARMTSDGEIERTSAFPGTVFT